MAEGFNVGHYRVRSLMKKHGLFALKSMLSVVDCRRTVTLDNGRELATTSRYHRRWIALFTSPVRTIAGNEGRMRT